MSRASAHSDAAGAKLDRDDLGEKVRKNIEKISYERTPQNIAAKSAEVPEPGDTDALASAAAANAYVADVRLPNPFAGRSRDQLSAIANDESGTFTTNEKYAAHRQANEEEQAWRIKAVAAAMDEYQKSGKLTNFFSSVLDHFNDLPRAEQSLYPANYATDLQDKIELDFNYFTHMPNGLPGKADISLANLRSMAGFDDRD
ncbi:hypothetical protein [Sphingomonas psychrotolerans]|uniref:Uncharacterized protein n=1 Tax=Sphingomonas psychrotolerans TaxID=1327635 RepID=A0A2K8MEA1_9SPHN|nr:hypothetical protein [Sphingomonas psychrotolerans]ATY30866.1 hypothetical protein CVN68_01735 [Sphingomonas psychrotolerans]